MGDVNYRIEALPVFVPLVVALAAFLAVRAMRGTAGPRWGWRFVPIRLVSAVYIAGVLGFTFFPFHIMYGRYADAVVWYDQVNWAFLITLDPSAVPNVIMTIPLGMLLPLVSGKITSAWRALAFGAVFSLTIEVSQVLGCVLFNNYRGADVNDVLVNALGCVLGYGIVRLAVRTSFLGDMLRRLALPGAALATRPQGTGTARDNVLQAR
ncbi:VanZ family protein [Streptomyces sp. NPDC046821]|uniref:VanZ family protein n=1 Tax=Streptomyces sp. NPDC046821 TaxID=3154702 RepID=UPI0033DC9D04